MKHIYSKLILFLSFITVSQSVIGQGIIDTTQNSKSEEKLVDKAKDLFKISGSIGLSGAYYAISGAPAQRDPFYWQLNGSLDITIGQVSMPFSATLNQQDRSFTQPFNQYGISPKFKWITTHLGYRSMRFSEYSLSGNQFLGAGIELTPEKSIVKGKMLFGRFAKAVDGYFTDGRVSGSPSFERWGGGFMVEVGKPNKNIGAFLFKGKDDKSSITEFANDATIKPAENLIVGLTGAIQIAKKLDIKGEIDFSAYTRDTRVTESVLEGYTYINNLGSLFYANATSSFNKAIKGEVSYTNKKFKVGLNYRRVDPDYLSMGSVYLNNDMEDFQLQTNFKTLKNKMSISLSGGLQRNNLSNTKSTEMLRLISAVAVTYVMNEHWTAMTNFSNFSTESNMQVVNSLDTMRFAQVTKSLTGQLMYNKTFSKIRIASGVNGSFQNAKMYQNDSLNSNSSSELFNANYSIQIGHLKSGINITTGIGAAKNMTGSNEIATLGPTLVVSKRFMKGKLNSSFSVSTLKSFLNGDNLGYILNIKSNNNYKINRHHAITNTLSLIQKSSNSNLQKQFIGTIGYNYVF